MMVRLDSSAGPSKQSQIRNIVALTWFISPGVPVGKRGQFDMRTTG